MKQIKNAFVSVFINNKYINISPRESRSLPVFKTIKILILRILQKECIKTALSKGILYIPLRYRTIAS